VLGLIYDEAGQDLTEYALLLVLIALIVLAALKTLGVGIKDAFANTASGVSSGT